MILRAAALAVLMAGAAAAQPVPEPSDYHGEPYRSPVPATLAGAQVADTAQAQVLHADGVPFLDVLPRTPKPEGLPEGTVWREPPHETIPGAVWLWNTGYDRLAPAEQARLDAGLTAATKGDKTAPVVIFCKRDCWMSWNAAKRAVAAGYTAVTWYPDGVDGWLEAGGDLVRAEPVAP